MLIDNFFRGLAEHLERAHVTQASVLAEAGRCIVNAMEQRHRTFVFGSGHSNLLTQEICMRAGGLPIFNPIFAAGLNPTDHPHLRCGYLERVSGIAEAILESSPVKKDDVLIVISNSGRNSVPVEMATGAKNRGIHVIALTSVGFSSSVDSRHISGKKLMDVADIVIDTGCPEGDAVVSVPNTSAKIGPLSTIVGAALLHALACQVAEILIAQGKIPPVFRSGNTDDGDEAYFAIVNGYKDLMTYI
jgi:uncharacterized phosphosugar-binding protein